MNSDKLPQAIRDLMVVLAPLRIPWAIAGGWAIDLALGYQTRPHPDIDIALFRSGQAGLRAGLPGWRFDIVIKGVFNPWEAGLWLELPVHEVHARPAVGTAAPALEFLLNEQDGNEWVYRREPAVRLPLSRAFRKVAAGLQVLAPEIVLLYKSKSPRPSDMADFLAAQPILDKAGRAWLRAALERTAPGHPSAPSVASYANLRLTTIKGGLVWVVDES